MWFRIFVFSIPFAGSPLVGPCIACQSRTTAGQLLFSNLDYKSWPVLKGVRNFRSGGLKQEQNKNARVPGERQCLIERPRPGQADDQIPVASRLCTSPRTTACNAFDKMLSSRRPISDGPLSTSLGIVRDRPPPACVQRASSINY